MNAEELWAQFCQLKSISYDTPHESWAFCDGTAQGDELAGLVVNGIKFGTASALDDYAAAGQLDQVPEKGAYSVILLASGQAVAVIRDYEVSQVPFGRVTAFHGYAEGEQQRTLTAWRQIHQRAFGPDLARQGYPLTDRSLIICEKFTVEYRPDTAAVRKLQNDNQNHVITPGQCDQPLYLAEVGAGYLERIADYRQELLAKGACGEGCRSLLESPDPAGWIRECAGWADPSNDCGMTHLLCLRKSDDRLIGMAQVGHKNTAAVLTRFGGIGYNVRPSERRKGYGSWMLAHILDYARIVGPAPVIICCQPGNTASRKVILANGGRLIETISKADGQTGLERYIIG